MTFLVSDCLTPHGMRQLLSVIFNKKRHLYGWRFSLRDSQFLWESVAAYTPHSFHFGRVDRSAASTLVFSARVRPSAAPAARALS